MGFHDTQWVLRTATGLTLQERAVLAYIADRADNKLVCRPSLARIASELETSEKHMRRIVHRLSEKGYVEITEIRGHTNLMRLVKLDPSRGWGLPAGGTPSQGDSLRCPSTPPRAVPKPLPAQGGDEIIEETREHTIARARVGERLTNEYATRMPDEPGAALEGKWSRAVTAGKGNPEVKVPRVNDWTPTRKRQIQKVHEKLKRSGKNWEDFFEEVREATNGGASSPIDLSLGRLTTKECERLDDLLEGKWRRQAPRAVAQEQAKEERDRALLDRIVSEKADAVPDHHAVLSNIRRAAGV